MLLFSIIMVVNLFIAWANTRACGLMWDASKQGSLWPRLVLWSGIIQSAIGFTLAYYCVIVMIAMATGRYPPALARYSGDVLTIGIAVPMLGSGLILTIQAWKSFLADKSLGNGLAAAWNTGAQVNNTVELGKGVFESIGDLFSSRDKDNQQGQLIMLAVLLVVVAALLGAITTALLVQHYIRQARLENRQGPIFA